MLLALPERSIRWVHSNVRPATRRLVTGVTIAPASAPMRGMHVVRDIPSTRREIAAARAQGRTDILREQQGLRC